MGILEKIKDIELEVRHETRARVGRAKAEVEVEVEVDRIFVRHVTRASSDFHTSETHLRATPRARDDR